MHAKYITIVKNPQNLLNLIPCPLMLKNSQICAHNEHKFFIIIKKINVCS